MTFSPEQTRFLIIANVLIWGTAFISWPIAEVMRRRRAAPDYIEKLQFKLHNRFVMLHRNALCRGAVKRIEKTISMLGCYSVAEVEVYTVQTFQKALVTSVLIPVVYGIANRELLQGLLAIIIALINFNVTINMKYDALIIQIYDELSTAVQAISDKYNEVGSIPNAINQIDKGRLIARPLDELFEILLSTNGVQRLETFCANTPVLLLTTLATTCFNINKRGDIKTDTSTSSFCDAMLIIRQECDSEILHLTDIRLGFKALPVLSLVGMICVPIFDLYMSSQIPGTSVYLKGTYGMIVKLIVVILTAAIYYWLSICMRPSVVNESDRSPMFDKLLLIPRFKKIVVDLIPKDQLSHDRLVLRLKGALSQKDDIYLYAEKLVFSAIAAVVSFVFVVLFVFIARDTLYHKYTSMSIGKDSAIEAEQFEQIKKMDNEYMAMDEPLDEDELVKYVRGHIRGMTDYKIRSQASRLALKYNYYHSLTWKWQFLLISIIATIGAWHLPMFMLKVRKSMIEYEAQEDVSQLMTMMIVFSKTNMDVFTSLYWLAQQSTVHKEAIRYCYYEYTSDPVGALEGLYHKTSVKEFHKLIRKLISCYKKLTLTQAFSDVVLDKAHYMGKRDRIRANALKSKLSSARMYIFIPIGIVLFFYFMGPILALGVSQLQSSIGASNTLLGK